MCHFLFQGGPGHLYLLKNKVATFAKVEKEEDMSLWVRSIEKYCFDIPLKTTSERSTHVFVVHMQVLETSEPVYE